MTEITEREEQANPYNQKKSWHNVKEKEFISADNPYFADPAEQEINSTEDKPEAKEAKKDKPYKRPNYKKRYDDLKSHYDRKLNEFKAREQELIEEATKNKASYKAPKTVEELEQFKSKHPDIFEVVETVAHMQSEEKAKVLEERLSALQDRETELVRKDAEKRLRDNHPDFDDIRNSDDFHSWAKSQPDSIQTWIYNNAGDADLASRALDLFKKDIGLEVTQPTSNSKQTSQSAADMISTKTTSVDTNQQRVWSEREIAAMSVAEFDKY